jgi:hypothetical protein
MYARAPSILQFDAATVNAHGGREGVQPFIDYATAASRLVPLLQPRRRRHPGPALADGRTVYEAVAAQA